MANPFVQLKSAERKILAIIGLGLTLSIYSLYVEIKHDSLPSYEALCDINSIISCSTAFLSDYGKGFGLMPEPLAFRNPVYGLLFYGALMVLLVFGHRPLHAQLVLVLAALSNLGTLFLGYILAFVLHVACVVCISLYVLNFLLLVFAWRRLKLIQLIKSLQDSKRHH